MRIFDATTEALLAEGRLEKRTAVLAELTPTPFAVWDDVYDINLSSQLYTRGAGTFTVGPMPSSNDLTVQGTTVAFSGLDPDVIAQIELVNYHQQPIKISYVLLNPTDWSVVYVKEWFYGIIDDASRDDQLNGPSKVTDPSRVGGALLLSINTSPPAERKTISVADISIKRVIYQNLLQQ